MEMDWTPNDPGLTTPAPTTPIATVPSPPPVQHGPRPTPEQTTQPPIIPKEEAPGVQGSTPTQTPPPGVKTEGKPVIPHREQREKKDSWKKKEAKESAGKGVAGPPSATPAPILPPTLPFRIRPPAYRQEDINAPPRHPTFTPAYQTPQSTTTQSSDDTVNTEVKMLEFFRVSDQPFNRKKFRYTPCAAAPEFPQIMYRGISLDPQRARINWQDMNPYVLIDREGTMVTTEKGYRMARTNVCVREGDWFVEFKVERGGGDQGGHVRVGFARRENVPVGFDGYSYGLRDVSGQKVHLSRPKAFMQPFGTGDIIGMHISLPSQPKPEQAPNGDEYPVNRGVFRDRIPIRFRGQLYFEQPDYTTSKEMEDLLTPVLPPHTQLNPSRPPEKPALPTLEGSFIDVYKNGVFQGRAFEDLLAFLPPCSQLGGRDLDDGALGYYPAISVFRYGIVRVNFGPDFLAFPQELEGRGVRGMWERYDEMIREEREWDLIDEMEWEKDAAAREAIPGGTVETVAVGTEIKELADDEWT